MPDAIVRLDFPAKADYLLLARLALAGLARTLPLDDELLADLKLAVTEACGNTVRHAYDDDGGAVRVSFVIGDDRLEMVVEDDGVGMDRPPDVEDLSPDPSALEGGMGMAIIRTVVDELAVDSGQDGCGTVVRMTKFLAAAT